MGHSSFVATSMTLSGALASFNSCTSKRLDGCPKIPMYTHQSLFWAPFSASFIVFRDVAKELAYNWHGFFWMTTLTQGNLIQWMAFPIDEIYILTLFDSSKFLIIWMNGVLHNFSSWAKTDGIIDPCFNHYAQLMLFSRNIIVLTRNDRLIVRTQLKLLLF